MLPSASPPQLAHPSWRPPSLDSLRARECGGRAQLTACALDSRQSTLILTEELPGPYPLLGAYWPAAGYSATGGAASAAAGPAAGAHASTPVSIRGARRPIHYLDLSGNPPWPAPPAEEEGWLQADEEGEAAGVLWNTAPAGPTGDGGPTGDVDGALAVRPAGPPPQDEPAGPARPAPARPPTTRLSRTAALRDYGASPFFWAHLTKLYASRCGLTSVRGVEALTSIKCLYLDLNRIQAAALSPELFVGLEQLQALDLASNPCVSPHAGPGPLLALVRALAPGPAPLLWLNGKKTSECLVAMGRALPGARPLSAWEQAAAAEAGMTGGGGDMPADEPGAVLAAGIARDWQASRWHLLHLGALFQWRQSTPLGPARDAMLQRMLALQPPGGSGRRLSGDYFGSPVPGGGGAGATSTPPWPGALPAVPDVRERGR